MKRVRTLIGTVVGLMLTSTAFAQTGGFDLAWNDCIGLPSAAQNLDYACDGSRDGNPFRLVVTFTPPSDLEHFVGAQVTMEIRTSSSVLPDWWRLGVGECRTGGIAFPGSRAGIGTGASGACVDPWASAANTGGGYQWTSDVGIGCGRYYCADYPRPGYAGLRLAVARDSEIPLQAGQRYLLPPVLIDPYDPHVDPDPLCLGCASPACLFVYMVELYQVAGQIPPQQDIYQLRRPVERAFVTWQGGQIGDPACSNDVPTRRATWGAIKAIYR